MMNPHAMFNEIYGIGPDHDHGQGNGSGNGNDEDGYTMDFGPKMLEEEAEESTPGSTQTKSKRKCGAISSESFSTNKEDSNASNASSSSTSAKPMKRYKSRYCKEEGCEKAAQGGLKGRCKRHARQHGDTYNRPRCIEEGCEKKACVKGRCRRHAREHAEKGGDP